MGKHHTQTSRSIQMKQVKNEIVRLGGWIQLEKVIGILPFTYYIADLLNCTKSKAKEYIDQAVQGSLAKARIDSWTRKVALAIEDKARKS